MELRELPTLSQKLIAADAQDKYVAVRWSDGASARFHYQWLRDNCRSDERFDHRTGERKALTESVPSELSASAVRVDDQGLHISWSDGGADSCYDAAWLANNTYDGIGPDKAPKQQTWGREYADALETFDYEGVMADNSIAAEMIGAFERLGLIRLTEAPTQERVVESFANRLAYVREIAFDRVADIRVSVNPYTLGFTNAALPLHTDCSGYSWPPNVMVFHCLKNEVAGGASQYADGARVVEQLRTQDSEALRILTEYDVEFRLWSDKADTLSKSPPIILDDAGSLAILRYANWTVQPLCTVPFDMVPRWYDAWRALATLVSAEENRVSYRCSPGEILLINNHRVLHGRDAFDHGEGVRHFQQVYMELDDLSGFRRIHEGRGGAR